MDGVAKTCARIADSRSFQIAVVLAILANAVVIGLETYDSIDEDHGALLATLNDVFLGLFTLEIAVRIAAYGRRPREFFSSGWNLFDFLVVGPRLPAVDPRERDAAAGHPAAADRAAHLGRARPARRDRRPRTQHRTDREHRAADLLPSLRLRDARLDPLRRPRPRAVRQHRPRSADAVPGATLEGWNEVLAKEMELTSWSWVYFVSFVLLATFVVLNVVIAVVVNSIEEAHTIEAERKRRELMLADPEHAGLYNKIEALKQALDDLEQEVIRAAAT